MPITPFHFGPGLLIKAISPRHVSWLAFISAQILIDCETVYHILRFEYPMHRTLHTFLGAGCAGLAAAFLFLLFVRLLNWLNPERMTRLITKQPFLSHELSMPAVIIGGLIGGLTHPVLDGIMHSDVEPFQPWTANNPLLAIVSLDVLHLICIITGIIGAFIMAKRKEEKRNHEGHEGHEGHEV